MTRPYTSSKYIPSLVLERRAANVVLRIDVTGIFFLFRLFVRNTQLVVMRLGLPRSA